MEEKNLNEEKVASLSEFLSLIKRTNLNRGLFIFAVILTLFGTVGGLIVPLLTQSFIDGFNTEMITTPILVAIILVFLGSAIIDGFAYYLLGRVGQTVIQGLREVIWDKFLKLPVSYFDQTKSGESVSRIVSDTSIIKDLITSHFPNLISGLLTIVGSIVILFVLDWKMTLIMFIALPLGIAVVLPLGRRMGKVSKRLQDETATFTGNTQETLSEIRLMKSYTGEKYERQQGRKGIKELYKYGMKEVKIQALISPIMSTIMMTVIIVVIGYGGLRVADGTLTIGTMVAFLLLLFQVMMPMTMFAMFFTEYNKALGATDRIIGILKLDDEVTTEVVPEISFNTIQFHNVDFSYVEGTPVLHDVNITLNKNEKCAFVGPSGSGKSTIFALIERYYELDDGKITIDGVDVRDIPISMLRGNVGYVAQESAIISGTILDNITYGLDKDSYTMDDVNYAIERSYAKSFIDALEDGVHTEVGERGVKLSGGQRQRIGIARAFLKDPKILMLDEATASLDSQSERFVQEALDQLMQNRTVLIIAHRLSTVVNSDILYFLENGKITGRGTHQELMENHEMYRTFTEQQFGES